MFSIVFDMRGKRRFGEMEKKLQLQFKLRIVVFMFLALF